MDLPERLDDLASMANDEFLGDDERLEALSAIRTNWSHAESPHVDVILEILTRDDAVAARVATAAGCLRTERQLAQGLDAEASLSDMTSAARAGATQALLAADAVRPGDDWMAPLSPADRLKARRLLDALNELGLDGGAVREEFSGGSAAVVRVVLAGAIDRECAAIGSDEWIARTRSPGAMVGEDALDDAITLERLLASGSSQVDLQRIIRSAVHDAACTIIEVLEGEAAHPDLPGWRLVELSDARAQRAPTGRDVGDLHPAYFRSAGTRREQVRPSG